MVSGRRTHFTIINLLLYYSFVCVSLILSFSSGNANELDADSDPSYQKRTLICTANVYIYTGESAEIPFPEDLTKVPVDSFVQRKTKQYLKKRLARGAIYKILPANDTNFQIMMSTKVDASIIGENLQGIRVGGILNYEIVGTIGDDFLSVAVDSDKSIYQEGDPLLFLVAGNKDFYMRLFEDSPDQKIFQIVPNYYKTQSFYPRGQYLFPDEVAGDQFAFAVEEPFGDAYLHLFGSEHHLNEIPVDESEPIEHVRDKYIKSILDDLVATDPSNTFQCVQFVESMKKLTFEK